MKRLLTLVALSFLLVSCGLVTGPNRQFRFIGNENVSDFITFEGTTLPIDLNEMGIRTSCRDLTLQVNEELVTVGCILNVQTTGGGIRNVLCTNRVYDQCREIPIGARVSINGELMSSPTLSQANSIKWTNE